MTRSISLLLSLAVGLTLMPLSAKAATLSFTSDLTWNVYTSDPGQGPASALPGPEYVAMNPYSPSSQPAGTVVLDPNDIGIFWTANLSTIPGAHWIWESGITGTTIAPDYQSYYFSKTFNFTGAPTSGSISVAGDDMVEVLINGTSLGTYGSVTTPQNTSANTLKTYNIQPYLVSGVNTITVMGENGPGSFSGYYVPGQPTPYAHNQAGVVFGGSISAPGIAPEPASMGALMAGAAILLRRRRRSR